ncbi:uncharacterized protein LOC106013227 [Aplysia californica]|uniref:Uncharacterized protein LOC106013227 n=1 Tax=Aplysia californica TaxID=6500 RepID=A0ABM1AA77_APLCA|nr:uncharacterized protein LOC106013227 [Aplysia californica]
MRPALALGLSPLGLLGAHHYYMNRSNWGLIYTCTLGLAGTGWIRDWFRIYFLIQRSNEIIAGERDKKEKTLDDAYMIWFPFGILGAHHFYLGRFTWGLIYMATAGVFTIGWILDVFRMPILVRESNQRRISMKAEDVEGNITPAFDDYNDNSVTLNAGDGKEEAGDDSKKDAGEGPSEDKIPEVKMASLQGAPNLVPNTK